MNLRRIKLLTGKLYPLLLTSFIALWGCDDFSGNSEKSDSPKVKVIIKERQQISPSHKNSGKKPQLEWVLDDIIQQVVTPKVRKLTDDLSQLNQIAIDNCALPSQKNSELQNEGLAVLKYFWTQAMYSYHQLEVVALGPLKESESLSLQSIYSYPSTNTCSIDIEVFRSMELPNYVYPEAINRLGLDAIEHFISQNAETHSCDPRKSRHMKGWENVNLEQKMKARCQYVRHVTSALEKQAQLLDGLWENYRQEATKAGNKKLLDELLEALFFAEKQTKDQVLGIPTGLSSASTRCKGRICLDGIEHSSTFFTKKQLLANLHALKSVFEGSTQSENSSFGLLDYIKSLNSKVAKNFDKRFLKDLDLAISNLEKLPDNYNMKKELSAVKDYSQCTQSSSQNRRVEACALYSDLRKVVGYLKKELPVILSVNLPVDSEGDGD